MKTIIQYDCEICGHRSFNKEEIERCESRGKPDSSKYPIGLIFGNANQRDNWRDITFCVAKMGGASWYPHILTGTLWACRDNGSGDNVNNGDYCGSDNEFILNESDIPIPDHPTFKRLVKSMKELHPNITITCWNGEKAILLKEFLKSRK